MASRDGKKSKEMTLRNWGQKVLAHPRNCYQFLTIEFGKK
jgi:hypothetical protein